MATTALVWLRNDLRLHDHEALAAALLAADRVVPVYCLDPRHERTTRWDVPKRGGHRTRFLLESLADLRAQMRACGGDLVVRCGRPEAVVPALASKTGAGVVCYHKEVTAEEVRVEEALAAALAAAGVRRRHFWGHTLYHINDLPFGRDGVPDVFSRFRRAVEEESAVRDQVATPETLPPLPEGLDAGPIPPLADLGVEAVLPDERAVLPFEGGERAGLARLEAYVWEEDRLRAYKETRNGLLGADYSSKLSPWLAHGCLSPRRVHAAVRAYERERVRNRSTYWLVFELTWRDFFRFAAWRVGDRLFHPGGPARRPVDWEADAETYARWRAGTTGIPFVDANMRELVATGFMSNRGRQNVASFLAKNLRLDWRMGAAWFEAQLVDYDVTSNWGNWAYVAGVGHDTSDRYFNIVTQARRYDPEGAYARRWLPVLADVKTVHVHAPHRMTRGEQEAAGAVIGTDYPAPMIDLEASYRRLRTS